MEQKKNKINKLFKEFGLTTMAVNNRSTVYVITLLFVVFGIQSYLSLPKENFPEVNIPTVYISTVYPGNSPVDIENLITRPLERKVKVVKGLDKLNSTSVDGYSAIVAEFMTGTDVTVALNRVKDAIEKAKADLPQDMPQDPNAQELDFAGMPILNVGFTGPYTKGQLREYARVLKEEVERIKEISKGEIKGVDDREVHINIDPYKMDARQINFNDIANAVKNENMTMSGGSIVKDGVSRSVRIVGEYVDPKNIEDIIVKKWDGKPVYLRDIAYVDYGYEDTKSFANIEGKNVVILDIVKRSGQNLLEATDQVYDLIDEMKEGQFPNDLELIITGDQSTKTRNQVASLENNIISGVILVVLVLLFFLNTRNALFVGVAIPLSMFISFMILGAFGITINMMVLFALIMALGMLVDNGIVVVENVYRLMEEGMSSVEAAKKGVGEVAWPIIASTATTLVAFLPLAFWPGMMGEFMKYLPITLMITLGSSLFVALVINPVLIASFMKVEKGHKEINHSKVLTIGGVMIGLGILLLASGATVFGNLIGIFGSIVLLDVYVLSPAAVKFQASVLPVLENGYEKVLSFALRGRNPIFFFGGTVVMFVLSIMLMVAFQPNVLFFPENVPKYVNVFVEYPVGTDIKKTIDFTNEVESKVFELIKPYNKIVESVVTTAGRGANDPSQGFTGENDTPHKGRITVNFVDFEFRGGVDTNEVMDLLREKLKGHAGVDITIGKNSDGPPAGKQIQIELSGEELTKLTELSEGLINQINNSGIQGIEKLMSDMQAAKPEYTVEIDREATRLFGISTAQIASEIRTSIFGKKVSTYKDGADDWDIMVRMTPEYRYNIQSILNKQITFRNPKGQMVQVPISSVAKVKLSSTYGSVKRKEMKRVVTITSNVLKDFNPTLVNAKIQNVVNDYELPYGYKVKFGGEQEKQAEEMEFLMMALMLGVFMIFLVIVAQFNQITTPFIIMTSVLLSTIGVFLGLIVFKMDFIIIMTMLGIISLAGIVVNNAIVLLDYTNLLKERYLAEGRELNVDLIREVIVKAGKTRLRPVLLTAITTVLGLIPLAVGINIDFIEFLQSYDAKFYIGGENVIFWGPMSWTIIFGLSFATFMTLVIVPVMYLLVDRIKLYFSK